MMSGRTGSGVQLALFVTAMLILSPADWWAPLLLAMLAGAFMVVSGDAWKAVGFRTPRRRLAWWVPEALVTGVVWQYAAVGLFAPLIALWLAGSGRAAGELSVLGAMLISVGLHPIARAVAFRSFLVSRLERLLGASRFARGLTFALAALIFGLGSRHQGWAGVALGTLTGALLNALYYWEGRSVWPTIVAHAAFNATALALLFL
jgi:membrane protease YdiL (CAAX protease family)